MIRKWEVKNSSAVLETPQFDVVKEECVDFAGSAREYYKVTSHVSQNVMVVPVKIAKKSSGDQISYIMVEQYRHGCGATSLEFPAGRCEKGEDTLIAAARELSEETGYKAKNMKFLYTAYLSPVRGADRQATYVALIEDEPGQTQHEPSEVGSGLKVVEISAEELHKKVLNNEIISSSTLAALSVCLLQSKKSIEYLKTIDA